MNTKYTKPTDQSHKIVLESRLLYAQWGCGVARGGAEAPVEVGTVFVGNGSDIEIVGRSSRGKAPGKIKGKVFNNRFAAAIQIPENVHPEAYVWFEARLPKHGLKAESNEIPAAPAVVCTGMQWDRAEARQGDVVRMSAGFEGVRGDQQVTVVIYEYDPEGNHDKIAAIPSALKGGRLQVDWEYRYHEDTAEIPTEQEMARYGKHYCRPQCFFVVAVDGVRIGVSQESGLLGFKDWVEVECVDDNGQPLSGRDFTVQLPDGQQREGVLDSDGRIRMEAVGPGKCQLRLASTKASRPRDPGRDSTVVHTVIRGETLSRIAKKYGASWKQLWNAPENGPLREKRKCPDILHEGDEIVIPADAAAEVMVCATGRPNRLQLVDQTKCSINMRLRDSFGYPFADTPCVLELEDGSRIETQTDEMGVVQADIPDDQQKVCIEILGAVMELSVGELDPVSTVEGVQQRLLNLGYDCGPVDGLAGRKTRAALMAFQSDMGLAPSGRLDGELIRELEGAYDGCNSGIDNCEVQDCGHCVAVAEPPSTGLLHGDGMTEAGIDDEAIENLEDEV